MRHEKEIKREDGSAIQIVVNFYDSYGSGVTWRYDLFVKAPRKKKWVSPFMDSYSYRSLSIEERRECRMKEILNYATQEELHQAALECWEKLKPEKV
jgi:hypothetical protein